MIKSDAHGFNLDAEGKDSWKFQSAGAKSVAVVSPQSWFMIQQTDERENFLSVAEKMSVDLILTESRTRNFFPTISLWRGLGEVIATDDVAAIFTSAPEPSDEIYNFSRKDLQIPCGLFDVANFAPAVFALNFALEKIYIANQNQSVPNVNDVLPPQFAEHAI